MRKHNKRQYSLLLALGISGVLFTLVSALECKKNYSDYSVDLKKQPLLILMFEAAGDRVYPWSTVVKNSEDEMINEKTAYAATHQASSDDGEESSENVVVDESDSKIAKDDVKSHTDKKNEEVNSDQKKNKKNVHKKELTNNEKANGTIDKDKDKDKEKQDYKENSNIYKTKDTNSKEKDKQKKDDENSKEEEGIKDKDQPKEQKKTDNKKQEDDKQQEDESDELTIGAVKEKYFADALFIGDSRTVGLSEYSKFDHACYYADVGLSVYTVFDKKIAKVGKKSMTIEKALKQKQFGKIYIMLGINEVGTGTTETFCEKYQEVIDRIQELQPDAYIIVQSIMNVGRSLESNKKVFNNKNIGRRNKGLSKLADQKKIFYLNVNEAVTDEEGYLPDEHTFDGIHLKAKYYKLWSDYLLGHAVVKENKKG